MTDSNDPVNSFLQSTTELLFLWGKRRTFVFNIWNSLHLFHCQVSLLHSIGNRIFLSYFCHQDLRRTAFQINSLSDNCSVSIKQTVYTSTNQISRMVKHVIHAQRGGVSTPPPSRRKNVQAGWRKERKKKENGKIWQKNRKMQAKNSKKRGKIEKTQQIWLKIGTKR